MNPLLQYQQDKAALIDKAGAILGKATTEKRSLTTDEQTNFDQAKAEIEALNATMARHQTLAGLAGTSTGNAHVDTRGAHVRENLLDKPFVSLGEQLIAIKNAENLRSSGRSVDPRLLELNERAASGASEAVPADGGFLLAPEFSDQIVAISHDTGIVRSFCNQVPINPETQSLKLPGIDEQSRADGSRWGGVRMYWNNEADSFTGSKPKFRNIEMVLKKLTGLFYSTDELLADSRALGAIVMKAFGEEVGFKVDDAIINGDGAGKPQGILTAPSLVTVAKETNQASATILYANVTNMKKQLWAKSWPNSVWFINQDTQTQLEKMFVPFTNVAGTENVGGWPAYLPPNGAADAPYGRLLGRPVYPIEQCSTVGTAGDIILADMSQYYFIDKGDPQAASSIHVRFINDETTFRWVYRVDGQPTWHSSLTPFKGSNKLSPFVALASR